MPEKKLKPLMTLSPEARKRIDDMIEDIERAEHSIDVMKELDMDTKALEERLEWAKKARKILLREF